MQFVGQTVRRKHYQKISARERYSYIMNIASKVLDKCVLVNEAILGEKVKESGDGVVDYARVCCHHASLALEFMDAVSEGPCLSLEDTTPSFSF